MKSIKNIIFDLGGVILNIDYLIVVKSFRELGIDDFDQWYSQKNQGDIFDKLETGKITPEEFHVEVMKHSTKQLNAAEINTAWNSMLLDLPAERIKLLQEVQKQYRCFLLSNTNEIHIEAYSASIAKKFGSIDIFNQLFEKVYYSSRVGMRKPNREIFEFVLNENNLIPAETLFIDDSPQHIEGAKLTGIHTIYLTKGKSILDLFDTDHSLIS